MYPRADVPVFRASMPSTFDAASAWQFGAALAHAPHAARAHRSAKHFLPLLVAASAAADGAPVSVLPGGIVHGVLSMESYLFGNVGAGIGPGSRSVASQPAPITA